MFDNPLPNGNGAKVAIKVLVWAAGIVGSAMAAFSAWAVGWAVLTVMQDHETLGKLDIREQGHYEALTAGQENRYTSIDAANDKAAVTRELDRLDGRVEKLEDRRNAHSPQ